MKQYFLILLLIAAIQLDAQIYPASNFTMISRVDPETQFNLDGDKYSACWGWYQSAKNKEYAIACSSSGTYWIDVTNPATPTVSAYQKGRHQQSTWREVKTYQNYCYVISDDAGANSFQIFDMQYLPDSVHKVHDSTNIFKRGHTLWIDGSRLYIASVTYSSGVYANMNVYSLATPTAPVLLRTLSQDYSFVSKVHDMYVRNDTVYASCAFQGLYVFKYDPSGNVFVQIGSLNTYPSAGYNHSSALTPDGKTLVFMDEVPSGLPIKVADVSNLNNIQVLNTINQYSATTPHNPFIVNNQYCFVSAYEEGLQLFDISNPAQPYLAGYFDTYPQGGGNTGSWANSYGGQWGCYPFFPSKNIFALDQSNGVFMLKTSLYSTVTNTVSTTGLEQVSAELQYQLFPQPANEQVLVTLLGEKINRDLLFLVQDVTGKQVMEIRASQCKRDLYTCSIPLSGVPPGFYTLSILDDEQLCTGKKLVISR